jgi:1,4-dihydroxy-2-naphthoyl-CoA hydrolase
MAAFDDLYKLVPFAKTLGMTIPEMSPERVVAELEWAPERTTSGGTLHGGAIMTLADVTGATCAFLNLPEGKSTTTTSSSTNFLRAVRGGTVTATARPIHVGRSTIVVVTEIRDDEGRLVAQVTQAQAVLSP